MLMGTERDEIAAGNAAFRELLVELPPSKNERFKQVVEQVGRRIAAVADAPHYDWEFRVVAVDEKQALCFPGGKVVVFEGMLPVCLNEGGLAAVLAHEVAHATSRHSGERQTQHNLAQVGAIVVDEYTRGRSLGSQLAVGMGYRTMAKYGLLMPYSRSHESEADHIGMLLLARAGFDPAEAVEFWKRMLAARHGPKPAEFASTHPSHEHRIADLRSMLPRANYVYQHAPQRIGRGQLILAAGSPLSGAMPAVSQVSRHFNAGVRLLEAGQNAAAVTEFTRVIALNPNDHEAHYNRGNALYRLGNFSGAMADYTAVLQRVPDYDPAHKNLQLTLGQLKGLGR